MQWSADGSTSTNHVGRANSTERQLMGKSHSRSTFENSPSLGRSLPPVTRARAVEVPLEFGASRPPCWLDPEPPRASTMAEAETVHWRKGVGGLVLKLSVLDEFQAVASSFCNKECPTVENGLPFSSPATCWQIACTGHVAGTPIR